MASDDPDERVAQLQLIHEEVERQLASYERRIQSMDSRAGILVAAAGLASTLTASHVGNGWIPLAIASALGSAVLGAIALFPGKAQSLMSSRIREEVYGLSEGNALLWLIDHKIELMNNNEKRIVKKAILLQAGFGLLAVAVFFIFMSVTGIQIVVHR
jgi:membrane associated rhomboid family serine protease